MPTGVTHDLLHVADEYADVGEHRRLARESGHYPHQVRLMDSRHVLRTRLDTAYVLVLVLVLVHLSDEGGC